EFRRVLFRSWLGLRLPAAAGRLAGGVRRRGGGGDREVGTVVVGVDSVGAGDGLRSAVPTRRLSRAGTLPRVARPVADEVDDPLIARLGHIPGRQGDR